MVNSVVVTEGSEKATEGAEHGGIFFWKINQSGCAGSGSRAEQALLTALHPFGLARVTAPAASSVLWSNTFEHKLWEATGFAQINHFPRSVELSHKDRLCRAMRGAGSQYLPETFVLPEEMDEWCQTLGMMSPPLSAQGHAKNEGYWIFKPVRAGGGRGVRVGHCDGTAESVTAIVGMSRASESTLEVVSRYIARPLLVEERKVDLRLYVLATSFTNSANDEACPGCGALCSASSGVTAHIFTEGFVRFASERYTLSPEALGCSFVHLTNNEINARNMAAVAACSLGGGTPDVRSPPSRSCSGNWTLAALWRELRRVRHLRNEWNSAADPVTSVWRRIRSLARATLESAQGTIGSAVAKLPVGDRCFELFGFDVLLDEDLNAWLCEVNSLPSLGVGGPVDQAVDSAMLHSMFNLLLGGHADMDAPNLLELDDKEDFRRDVAQARFETLGCCGGPSCM